MTRIGDCTDWCTDRQWVMMLNAMVCIGSAGQVVMALIFLIRIFGVNDGDEDELYTCWVALCVIGCMQFWISVFGIVAAQKVSIDLLVAYFSMTLVLLAPYFLFTVSSFEYQSIFRAWLRHRWSSDRLGELRQHFCDPAGAWNTWCRAGPLAMPANWTTVANLTSFYGEVLTGKARGDSFGVDEWCLWYYSSSECSAVYTAALNRSAAWAKTRNFLLLVWFLPKNFLRQFYVRASGAVSLFNVLLLVVCLDLTYRIVTPALIKKYMSTKVNAMLALPAVANLIVGLDLTGNLTGRETTFARLAPSVEWIGYLALAAALLLLALMLLGSRAETLRGNPRLLSAYAAGLGVCLAALTAAGVWCVVVSLTISSESADWEDGAFACDANLYGCSNCAYKSKGAAAAVDLCPEWTRSEVLAYVAIYLRVAGFCALGSGLYVAAGIVSARKLARNLRDYRCEYV